MARLEDILRVEKLEAKKAMREAREQWKLDEEALRMDLEKFRTENRIMSESLEGVEGI